MIRRSPSNNVSRGVSVIEAVAYVAILTIVLGSTIYSLVSFMQSYATIRATFTVNDSVLATFDRLSFEIRQSESVNLGQSTFDTHPGVLVLERDGGASTVTFELDNGRMSVSENGMFEGYLTASSTEITELVFRHVIGTSSEMVIVETEFEVQQRNSTKTQNAQSAVVLRGAYNN